MDDFGALLKQLNNKEALALLGNKVGAKPDQVGNLVELALPTLLEALNRNVKTEAGAESLNKALTKHQDVELNDLGGFLNGVDQEDGMKIIGHILGKKTDKVEQQLAKSSGLEFDQVAGLLSQFAPLILAFLGNQKKQTNASANDLGGLIGGLGSLLGGSNNDLFGMAAKLLDADGDGDASDDLGKLLGGLLKK
jgi:hypothetical protein